MDKEHEGQQQSLERFKMLTERHLSRLEIDLQNFEKLSASEPREVFFSEILRRCNDIKGIAETHAQPEIKELIGDVEIVVELLRRKKMEPTAETTQLLHKTIKTISQRITIQTAGNESGQDMFRELREHYHQIKSRHTSI